MSLPTTTSPAEKGRAPTPVPEERLPGVPRWRVGVLAALATYTPLRFPRVRAAAFRVQAALARQRRARRERRGDHTLSTPALYGCDVRLAELLGSGGFFVEAGAHDGYTQSNTYYLERFHGWSGLLVEPIPALCAEARRNRPNARVVQAALTDADEAGGRLTMKSAGVVSLVAGARGSEEADRAWVAAAFARGETDVREVDVPARTLSELLDEMGAPEVDLLSLDLEGYEPRALRGLDLQRHAPRWLLVEAHDEGARDQVKRILGDRYVHAGQFSPWDELYRRSDIEPLTGARSSRARDAPVDDGSPEVGQVRGPR